SRILRGPCHGFVIGRISKQRVAGIYTARKLSSASMTPPYSSPPPRRPPGGCRGGLRPLLLAAITAGCAGPSVQEKLARVGIALVPEADAGIPEPERGQYVPVSVLEGFQGPALPPHPAGYLVVGVIGPERELIPGAEAVREALEAWGSGETLEVRVRRNPYLQWDPEWWEAEVRLNTAHHK
ncbi:MAG TPA: hypothetical protein VMT52_05915, partial [Planctomycetota bacterium]|nr:hypothetical protein [Planctomycetota bacterium]